MSTPIVIIGSVYGSSIYGGTPISGPIEKEILQFFNGSPKPVAGLVATYWARAAVTAATPYMVVTTIAQRTLPAHSGRNRTTIKTFQFSLFGPRQDVLAGLGDEVYGVLEGYRGTFATVPVDSCFLLERREAWEDTPELHHHMLTFEVSHH